MVLRNIIGIFPQGITCTVICVERGTTLTFTCNRVVMLCNTRLYFIRSFNKSIKVSKGRRTSTMETLKNGDTGL